MSFSLQYPLNIVGEPHGSLAVGKVVFKGPTGAVGTAYGVPSLGAVFIATGMVRVSHAAQAHVTPFHEVTVPSGNGGLQVQVVNRQQGSGTYELHFTRPTTGLTTTVNPATGTVVDVLFQISPVPKIPVDAY